MKSNLTVPIAVGGRYVCALATGAFREYRTWDEETIDRVRLVGQILANAVHRKRTEEQLRLQLDEIRALKDQLQEENVYLREEIRGGDFTDVVGQSPALGRVLERVSQVAPTSSSVLLLGETGTGQGAPGAGDPRAQPPPGQGLHQGQLRRPARVADRDRAAGPREGRLHGRDRGAPRPLRAGRRGDALPRRDRRPRGGAAVEAAARAAGRRGAAPGRDPLAQGGRPPRGRDQPGPRARDGGGALPARPLLPPERLPDPDPAPARAAERTSP